MQVNLPGLDMVVGVISEPGKVTGDWSVVLYQVAEQRCIRKTKLKLMMPFAKLYFWVFSSGKDSVRSFGNSRSLTETAGEFWTCFLASVSYWVGTKVLRRRFCRVVAKTCPKSGFQSKR